MLKSRMIRNAMDKLKEQRTFEEIKAEVKKIKER